MRCKVFNIPSKPYKSWPWPRRFSASSTQFPCLRFYQYSILTSLPRTHSAASHPARLCTSHSFCLENISSIFQDHLTCSPFSQEMVSSFNCYHSTTDRVDDLSPSQRTANPSKAEMISLSAAPTMVPATQILNKYLLKEWTERRKADSNKWKYQIMDFQSFSFLMPSKPQTSQFPGLHRQTG